MSVREGTRRKKISVLHMLGTWEGKIEGCNCPSCKEYEEEKLVALTSKSASRAASKTGKGTKGSPKKTVIKVKTTKVVVDVGTGDVIERKGPTKKYQTLKKAGGVHDQKSKSLLPDFGNSDESGISKKDLKIDRLGSERKKDGDSNVAETVVVGVKDAQIYDKYNVDPSQVIREEKGYLNEDIHDDQEILCDDRSADSNSVPKVLVLSSPQKPHKRLKLNSEASSVQVALHIKQEPEDFFSDEDEFDRDESGDVAKFESRVRKRPRMVTSEVENIYAKPRMVFTGRGVVKKFEPGVDKTPKSKRGRKPAKVSPVKVKQEPKDDEENDENDMDQLQKALNEATEDLYVGDDLLDALNDFEDEPKEVKVKKKAKFKMLKRVDSDGDKYIECNMCFKMLKESSMKQHYKTHTGEKPHICDECDARFTRKGDVERHKRLVHKNQKPFKCRKCKRNFSDRKNLKLHLQNHDKATYYACNTCGFKFGKREYYENHIRYIHPLPDGSVPAFGDMDQDIALEQLQEIEQEERKEKQEKEGKGRSESVLPVKSEVESLDDDEDEEEATEITVTEGSEENPKLRKCDSSSVGKNSETLGPIMPKMEVTESNDSSDASCNLNKCQVGTDIRVSRGTLSFTQTVSDTGSQDDELVDKVIADAVNQAANTIESLQTIAGANMSGNDIDLDDDDDDEEEDEEDEMEEEDEFQEILDANDYDIIPIEQKPIEQPSEIHISASVGGQKKKFIIQVPAGSNLNVQTPEGMEMIVSMVNQLCGGKGELDGPIEVVMQNAGTRALPFD